MQGLKGVRQVKWGVLGGIASGWVTTPVIAALISFVSLFIVQNVFAQQVYQPVADRLSPASLERLTDDPDVLISPKSYDYQIHNSIQKRQYF